MGPLGAGRPAAQLGYNGFFYVFAGIAVVAAIVFLALMPETADNRGPRLGKKGRQS